MVDKSRRKLLATHLRHFSSGQISNDEFEERVIDDVSYGYLPEYYHNSKESLSDDPVVRPVLEMAWCLYDDTREQEFEQMKKSGNFEFWPFKTKAQFQKQLENQPFLSGIEK